MTQEIVDSPMPSMVNYPEPTTNDGMSEIGFDKTGSKYKLSNDYLLGWNNSNIVAPTSTFTVEWEANNQKKAGVSLIEPNGNTHFKLAPGYVYRLTSKITPYSSDGSISTLTATYQWHENKTSQGIGKEGYSHVNPGVPLMDISTPAVAYIEVEKESLEVYLVCTNPPAGLNLYIGAYYTIETVN